MIAYIRCCNCKRKSRVIGTSFQYNECPDCKSTVVDLYMGRVPGWWTPEDELAAVAGTPKPPPVEKEPIKVYPTIKMEGTMADPLFIGWGIYAGVVYNPWWWVVVPLVVGSWFINPRWNKAKGWRWWHD